MQVSYYICHNLTVNMHSLKYLPKVYKAAPIILLHNSTVCIYVRMYTCQVQEQNNFILSTICSYVHRRQNQGWVGSHGDMALHHDIDRSGILQNTWLLAKICACMYVCIYNAGNKCILYVCSYYYVIDSVGIVMCIHTLQNLQRRWWELPRSASISHRLTHTGSSHGEGACASTINRAILSLVWQPIHSLWFGNYPAKRWKALYSSVPFV